MTIEVLNVNKNYGGKPCLKNVSLNISSGSVISVVGTKKSGKTALLRIIMGLEEADGGQVTLLGDYKYQDDRLCPGFTAAQNVAMVNKKLSVRVAAEELEKLLPAGTADLPVEDLTPAQRRMVCIIRACIIPSDVRLMDGQYTSGNYLSAGRRASFRKDLSPFLTPFGYDRAIAVFSRNIFISTRTGLSSHKDSIPRTGRNSLLRQWPI